MEKNIEKWHQSKLRKYENEISGEAKKNGWRFYSIIVEVGARGWYRVLSLLHSGNLVSQQLNQPAKG
jgi:hypothetical protein